MAIETLDYYRPYTPYGIVDLLAAKVTDSVVGQTISKRIPGILRVNDYLLVVVQTVGASGAENTANSVAINSGPSLTKVLGTASFTIWIYQNTSGASIFSPTVTITASAATNEFAGHMTIVRGATGYNISTMGASNQAATSILSTVLAVTARNNLIFATSSISRAVSTFDDIQYTFNRSEIGGLPEEGYHSSTLGNNSGTTKYWSNAVCIVSSNGKYVGNPIASRIIGYTTKGSTASLTSIFYTCSILFMGSQLNIEDDTYKLNNGPAMNTASVLPFYDVENVQGLSDLNVDSSSDSLDGTDGSYVGARYSQGKTVVLDGTAYSNPPFDETLFDNMRAAAAPTRIPVPFLYKLAGKTTRQLNVFPAGFKSDINRSRALNSVPFQLQMLSEDSSAQNVFREYISLNVPAANGFNVLGNVNVLPDLYFSLGFGGAGGDVSRINNLASNNPYETGIIITRPTQGFSNATFGLYRLSFSLRKLEQFTSAGWVDVSNLITTLNWFALYGNQENCIEILAPNFVGNNAFLAYDPRW